MWTNVCNVSTFTNVFRAISDAHSNIHLQMSALSDVHLQMFVMKHLQNLISAEEKSRIAHQIANPWVGNSEGIPKFLTCVIYFSQNHLLPVYFFRINHFHLESSLFPLSSPLLLVEKGNE